MTSAIWHRLPTFAEITIFFVAKYQIPLSNFSELLDYHAWNYHETIVNPTYQFIQISLIQ